MNAQRTPKKKSPPVKRDHALHLLQNMIRIRRLEEKCAELYSTMKIRGFMHLYDGEEAVAVAIFMGGGPAMVYGCEALAALDQFEAAGVAGNIGTP